MTREQEMNKLRYDITMLAGEISYYYKSVQQNHNLPVILLNEAAGKLVEATDRYLELAELPPTGSVTNMLQEPDNVARVDNSPNAGPGDATGV